MKSLIEIFRKNTVFDFVKIEEEYIQAIISFKTFGRAWCICYQYDKYDQSASYCNDGASDYLDDIVSIFEIEAFVSSLNKDDIEDIVNKYVDEIIGDKKLYDTLENIFIETEKEK